MVVLVVGALVVSSSALTLAETTSSETAVGCGHKNEFLVNLHKGNVSIFENPQPSTGFCGAEWTTHGTCCETNSLLEYAKKDMGNIGGFLERMESENNHVRDAVVMLIDVLSVVSTQIENSDITGVSLPILTSVTSSMPRWKNLMQQYLIFMRAIRYKFKRIQKKCAVEMNHLRSSSFCSTCSGRSELFFVKDKMLIDQPTCHEFVDNCFDAWTMLIQIMNGMKRGRDIVGKLRAIRPTLRFGYRAPALEKMQAWIKDTLLAKSIRKCLRRGGVCSERTEKVICENLLNLNKPTFLEDTVGLLIEAKNTINSEEFKRFIRSRTNFNEKKSRIRDRLSKQKQDRKSSKKDHKDGKSSKDSRDKLDHHRSSWLVKTQRLNNRISSDSANTVSHKRTDSSNKQEKKSTTVQKQSFKKQARSNVALQTSIASKAPPAMIPPKLPVKIVKNSKRKLFAELQSPTTTFDLSHLPVHLSNFDGHQAFKSPDEALTANHTQQKVSSNSSSESHANKTDNTSKHINQSQTLPNDQSALKSASSNASVPQTNNTLPETNPQLAHLATGAALHIPTVIPFAESGQYLSDTTVVCTYNRNNVEFKGKLLMDPMIHFIF